MTDIDPGWAAVLAAVFASLVSLALGVVSIMRASQDARSTAEREQVQRRAEAYVDLLRVVERRGIAVQDEMFNITETMIEPHYGIFVPKREVDEPPRSDRAEALALVTAYGTTAMREALGTWIDAVDAWNRKEDSLNVEFQSSGPRELSAEDAEPERANEVAARARLGESVSVALAM